MTNAAPLLALQHISRHFQIGDDRLTVLDNINLDVHAGEMVAIIGASGSGKSTLMNILGCLDRPSHGEYRVNGQSTATLNSDQLADLRRDCFGFIFQRYHLLSHLKAESNVEIPAIYAGKNKTSRLQRARSLLQRLGIANKQYNRPSQLSGGQQQRVSIARALMNGGTVILADEPTGALDSQSGKEVMQILRQLHRQGHTIVLVTHDQNIAAHAERVLEISDGRILADRRQTPCHIDMPVDSQDLPDQSQLPQAASWWVRQSTRFSEAFRMAWLSMLTHRMRTLLTMLGIIIGITAVVSVVAVGQGARNKVISDISSMGTNTIDVYPGKDWGDRNASAIQTLTPQDLPLLSGQIYTDSVTPSVSTNALLRDGGKALSAMVYGVAGQYFQVKDLQMAYGKTFDQTAVKQLQPVVVIDHNTLVKLYGEHVNPVGKVILLNNLPCRIIGVTAEKKSSFDTQNLNVWLPYTSAMYRLMGQYYFSSISVRIKDGVSSSIAEQQIIKLLTRVHGRKDFYTRNSDSILQTIEKTTATLTLLISSIAVISLIVGGIGVMNIMLVSVTERTREIGIRMAIGARQQDILQQFLIEAVMVCLLGGSLGIALSFAVSAVFSFFVSSIQMAFSVWSLVSAFLCSSLIGVLFGYLPARNAARLDPIEALARE
ncbi:MacB family efflux pump subunit [uncultured Tolumonas sp.]|uniref:MacB family efflux pump subunit n=1 Tax=uncultured Tolumonas sp. TaxID=263765 RepID=UPI002930257B|nr:MacB family efflux pump subunit [uncultured Tolumonas sp.]